MRGASPAARDVLICPPGPPGLLKIQRYWAEDGSTGQPLTLGPLMVSSRAYYALPRRPAPRPRPDTMLPGGHVWAGMIYGHFGHFITETLPRLLSIRTTLDANPAARIAGFAAYGTTRTDLGPMAWFLDRAGIDPARIDVITAPTRLTSLIIPPAPFPRRFAYAPEVAGLIDRHGLSAPQPSGEHIFLSRGQLATSRSRVTNIPEIEALFAESGYTILHPETLDLAQQIARITSAEVLAGENGSALHWSLYSRSIRRVQSLGWSLALQRGICALRDQQYQVLRAPWTGWAQGRSQHVPARVVRHALQLP